MKTKIRPGVRGFTLLEMVITTAVLTTVMCISGIAMISFMRILNNQMDIVESDRQGYQILDRITTLLTPAVLPARVKGVGAVEEGSTAINVFADIDNTTYGFGNGMGARWRESLNSGMSSIAFIHPLDPQGTVTYIDEANHLMTGLTINGKSYFGSSVSATTNSDGTLALKVRDQGTNELVNVLANVDPREFDSPDFEAINNPAPADWQTVLGSGSWPSTTVFAALRFLPLLDAGGNPVLMAEANAFAGNPVDLDMDGNTAGIFEIGKLQLLYSGSDSAQTVNVSTGGGGAKTYSLDNEPLDQIAIDLTGYVVLRNAVEADRVPIFQFVKGEVADPDDSSSMLLKVSLLMLPPGTKLEGGVTKALPHAKGLSSRWYEASIAMKNMQR